MRFFRSWKKSLHWVKFVDHEVQLWVVYLNRWKEVISRNRNNVVLFKGQCRPLPHYLIYVIESRKVALSIPTDIYSIKDKITDLSCLIKVMKIAFCFSCFIIYLNLIRGERWIGWGKTIKYVMKRRDGWEALYIWWPSASRRPQQRLLCKMSLSKSNRWNCNPSRWTTTTSPLFYHGQTRSDTTPSFS